MKLQLSSRLRVPSVRQKHTPSALLLTFGMLLVAPLYPQSSGPSGAWVASLTGTLTVQRPRSAPHAVKLNDPVVVGDELITGENSYATIQTSGGARVEIFPDSHIIFSEQSADIQEFLHLFFGSIKVYIEKLTGRPNPHRMTTPTAVIAVRGTTFSVFVDENNSTLVAVDEGAVAVANVRYPNQEVILREGQRTWIHDGQPPAEARAFRGGSERADLIPRRMGSQSMNVPETGMRGAMDRMDDRRMEQMSGSWSTGSTTTMSGHTGVWH